VRLLIARLLGGGGAAPRLRLADLGHAIPTHGFCGAVPPCAAMTSSPVSACEVAGTGVATSAALVAAVFDASDSYCFSFLSCLVARKS
jgi:hypothetical protein